MPSIGGAIKSTVKDLLKLVFGFLTDIINPLFQLAKDYLTSTPYPDNIDSFGPPTKGLWPQLYHNLYDELVIVLLPTLFALALGLAMFFNIFSEKQKKQGIRRAVIAFPFAISWWWFGGWFLKFTNDFASLIVADASLSGSLGTELGSSIGTVVFVGLIYIFGITIVLLIIAIFVLRQIAIYAYMVAMPVLLMFWVVPIKPVSGWAKSMMGKFVPLVLMTIPTALLLRIGSMFIGGAGQAVTTGSSSLGTDVVSTILGFAAIGGAAVVPKYMFSFSGGVSRAVRKGSRTGRAAMRGARRDEASAAASGGRGSQAAGGSRSGGVGGGASSETSEEHKHEPDLDFSSQRRMRSQRRRRQKRAERVGAGARKTARGGKKLAARGAKKVAGKPAKRAASSIVWNHSAKGSTPRGVADDATDFASRYRQRINERMAVRSEELQEKLSGETNDSEYATEDGELPASEDSVQTERDSSDTGDSGSDTEMKGADEPATDSHPNDSRMESGDLSESSEEWSRSDARTADFSTNTQDRQSGEDAAGEESSDD